MQESVLTFMLSMKICFFLIN